MHDSLQSGCCGSLTLSPPPVNHTHGHAHMQAHMRQHKRPWSTGLHTHTHAHTHIHTHTRTQAQHLSMRCPCPCGVPPGTEPYRLYNLDVFEYLHESPFGLYGSIPLMVAHKQGLTTGVFWWGGVGWERGGVGWALWAGGHRGGGRGYRGERLQGGSACTTHVTHMEHARY